MEEVNFDIMRYELDDLGYVCSVLFGCASGTCVGYEGEVPSGYASLEDWAINANIRAYKIVEGNLVLDNARNKELQDLFAKEAIDNACVRHKDLFELENAINGIIDISNSQYQVGSASGNVIAIDNVKSSYPRIKISNFKDTYIQKLRLIISQKNLLRNEAISEEINGITFIQNEERSITIKGTSTSEVNYNILGTNTSEEPYFCFKKNEDYYLTCGDFNVKMYCNNGNDKELVFDGTSGVIRFDVDKPITQVLINIPSNTTIEETTIFPQLELGTNATDYVKYKQSTFDIDLSEFVRLVPSDNLVPSDDLVPNGYLIDYLIIENGTITLFAEGKEFTIGYGRLSIFDYIDIVYAIEDVFIEMDYCTNVLNVQDLGFLQGKATTTNKFKIREDGSIEAHDGYFSGDIYLSEGGKVIGGDGILTSIIINGNVNSNTFGGNAQMLPMGYSLDNNNGSSITTMKDCIKFEFDIPQDFTITKANIKLKHIPCEYKYMNKTEHVGYCRNLKLYKNNEYRTTKFIFDYGYMRTENNDNGFDEIYDAFGENGFTGSPSEYVDFESVDIKEEINVGFNCLKIETSNDLVTSLKDMYEQSGAVMAILTIYGYMSFSEESGE